MKSDFCDFCDIAYTKENPIYFYHHQKNGIIDIKNDEYILIRDLHPVVVGGNHFLLIPMQKSKFKKRHLISISEVEDKQKLEKFLEEVISKLIKSNKICNYYIYIFEHGTGISKGKTLTCGSTPCMEHAHLHILFTKKKYYIKDISKYTEELILGSSLDKNCIRQKREKTLQQVLNVMDSTPYVLIGDYINSIYIRYTPASTHISIPSQLLRRVFWTLECRQLPDNINLYNAWNWKNSKNIRITI